VVNVMLADSFAVHQSVRN